MENGRRAEWNTAVLRYSPFFDASFHATTVSPSYRQVSRIDVTFRTAQPTRQPRFNRENNFCTRERMSRTKRTRTTRGYFFTCFCVARLSVIITYPRDSVHRLTTLASKYTRHLNAWNDTMNSLDDELFIFSDRRVIVLCVALVSH